MLQLHIIISICMYVTSYCEANDSIRFRFYFCLQALIKRLRSKLFQL